MRWPSSAVRLLLLAPVALTLLAADPLRGLDRERVLQAYAAAPLAFEANAGQADPAVRFLARGSDYTLFVTASGATLALGGPGGKTAALRLEPTHADRAARPVGAEPLPARTSYLVGADPRGWHTAVPSYAAVRWPAVYPGVDLVFRGDRRRLEYAFLVAPGADPRRIGLDFAGASRARVDAAGALVLETAAGEMVQPPPFVYQEVDGARRRVAGRFLLTRGCNARRCRVRFELDRYDRGRELVIDPTIGYASFIATDRDDFGPAIAVDAHGYAYVAGTTYGQRFPMRGSPVLQPQGDGSGDAFVIKIDPSGSRVVFTAFLGGSGLDRARALALDAGGNIYLVGDTSSADFPGVGPASLQPQLAGFDDAFVAKLAPDATQVVYATFLGPSSGSATAIAVDATGNAYVAGTTFSATWPGTLSSRIQNHPGTPSSPWITKLDPSGTKIVWSTFLGALASLDAIAVDGDGATYVAGSTTAPTWPGADRSPIQPQSAGRWDGFVTKIDPGATAIVFSTFLGGRSDDFVSGLAVGAAHDVYVAGTTASDDLPGLAASPRHLAGGLDAFVSRIDASGSHVVYTTPLGGSSDDRGVAVALDPAGDAFVTGSTTSADFPVVAANDVQPMKDRGSDAFVAALDGSGAITYSTFYGGNDDDAGEAIAVDREGNAYVVGSTLSVALPGLSYASFEPEIQDFFHRSLDLFVARIGSPPPPGACVPAPATLCIDQAPGDRRWQVTVHYSTAQGGGLSGPGMAVSLADLGVSHGGLFWFFGADNPEVLVKVLDGCSVNGAFWVFLSAGTNVAYTATVRDMRTGQARTYQNADLTVATPVQDTNAFGCDATAATTVSSEQGQRVTRAAPAAHAVTGAEVTNLCVPDATSLCIEDRYRVRVSYSTTLGGGRSGDAQAIPLDTLGVARGGLFWFFAPDNPEMLVKVLDGCRVNGHRWVFSSAGTSVGLAITVTDTANGNSVTYRNADLHPAAPIQDTSALPCDSFVPLP